MACYHPLQGYRSKILNPNGKRSIVFSQSNAHDDGIVTLPCGQCVGCRLERSRQWAIRCAHEASLYENNCFITLTYNNEHLPEDKSLDVTHYQKFMKRLRKRFGADIRFFHCGEYGENFGRPHYHACIFNFDFPDKKLWKITEGNNLYTSQILQGLWPFGFSSIGAVTFQSAAYVARYIMKKVNGAAADQHYEWIDPETGEIFWRKPEYTTMSRRPGIGKGWFDKYHADVYPDDFVLMNEKKMRPPKFYDSQFELLSPFEYDEIKHRREENSKKHFDNNTYERLQVREQVQNARLKQLIRPME